MLAGVRLALLGHRAQASHVAGAVGQVSRDDDLVVGIDDGLGVVALRERPVPGQHDPAVGVGEVPPLKSSPWRTSPDEALGAKEGFSDSRDFWRMLLWGLLLDVPRGLDGITCPVTLVQGAGDWISSGQTVRYLPLVPGSRFRPLLAAGHAPQSDRPRTLVRLVERTAARAGAAALAPPRSRAA